MINQLIIIVCLHFCLFFHQLACLNDNRDKDVNYDDTTVSDHLGLYEQDSLMESEISFGDIYNPMSSIFPEVNGDLTLITWKHAVNSRAKLEAALNSSALMLEADVIIGSLTGDPKQTQMPVMGHPPEVESDISLDDFINTVWESRKNKGIKLDFKSIEAFLNSVKVLEKHDNGGFPIWLNADILPGPVNPQTVPVDADQFLNTSVQIFPDYMLSIGWTTHYAPNGKYTDEQIEQMTSALNRNNVLKPVTFPVRAVFATECIDKLQYLVHTSPPGSSLTVWMSNDADPVNIPKLKRLIDTIGKDKTFLDVPDFVRERLNSTVIEDPNSSCSLKNNLLITTLAVVLLGTLYVFH